jgi:hypothetical protein
VITFNCNSCGKELRVKDEFAGREGKCPLCGRTMQIPSRDAPREPEPEIVEPLREEVPPEPVRSSRPRNDDDEPPRRMATEENTEENEEIRNHAGSALSPQDDFFTPPPEEIGDVISAYTTLRKGVEPKTPGARLGGAIVAGVVGLALGIVIALAIKNVVFQIIVPLSLGGLGLAIVLFATGFKHTCTYVGKDGVARYTCRGAREEVTGSVFCFKDASELRTSQTRHYTNGVYQGTHYSFSWTDIGGRSRFVIAGQHRSEAGTPANKDQYHFATSSERAWTIYLLNQVSAQLKMSGTIYFGLGGKNWVKLGERRIILYMSGVTTECDADEIAEVRIYQGMVEVRRKNAKEGWFSSSGIFKFPYGSLGNAQLFLILMDKVVEVPIN